MNQYRVKDWRNHKVGYVKVWADSAKDAAEKVCGCALHEQGARSALRALVRLSAPEPGMSGPTNFFA